MKKIGRAPVGVMICVTCRALHYLAEWMLCTRHFLTTQRKSIKYKVATLYVSYYKKLSCHIEAMRCFTKSLEVISMTPLSRACLSPCYYSIGTRSLSRTISEMFGIKWWHDLELWVRSHSRSLEMAPFDRPEYKFLLVFYSNYGPILCHFRDKARFWRKSWFFIPHLCLMPQLEGSLLEYCHKVWYEKNLNGVAIQW